MGDPEECYAIDDFFCKTRKTPLPIGSVKSSIGHTEPVSGLCSVVKVKKKLILARSLFFYLNLF